MRPWWQRWRPGPAPRPQRWVVLDVESSGLVPRRDRLLAVAAVAVQLDAGRLLLRPGDSFEVLIQQGNPGAAVDKANILVHGIGVEAQRQGQPGAAALAAFEAFVDQAPLLAFHAGFDRVLIARHLRQCCGRRLPNPWLDLADLAPAVCPELRAQSLDDWLGHFGIEAAVRHQAAADAWATAQLLQRLWPLALAMGCAADFAALARLATSRRWLRR